MVPRSSTVQNRTSLPGYVLDKFAIEFVSIRCAALMLDMTDLPKNVTEKMWHTVQTVSAGDNTCKVLLDNQQIAAFKLSSYVIGNPNPYMVYPWVRKQRHGIWPVSRSGRVISKRQCYP